MVQANSLLGLSSQGAFSQKIAEFVIYKLPARYGVGQNEDGYHSRPLSIHFGFICAVQNVIYAYIVELS